MDRQRISAIEQVFMIIRQNFTNLAKPARFVFYYAPCKEQNGLNWTVPAIYMEVQREKN